MIFVTQCQGHILKTLFLPGGIRIVYVIVRPYFVQGLSLSHGGIQA